MYKQLQMMDFAKNRWFNSFYQEGSEWKIERKHSYYTMSIKSNTCLGEAEYFSVSVNTIKYEHLGRQIDKYNKWMKP